MPSKPSSAMRLTSSAGWRCSLSIAAALGSTSCCANSRASFWTASCSSLSVKFTIVPRSLAHAARAAPPARARSLPLEPGRAPRLGEERGHAFASIVGAEQHAERLLLERDRVLERRRLAEVNQPLDLGDGERAVADDAHRELVHLRVQLALWPHGVDEPDAQRLARVDRVAGHAQLLALRDADASREPLRAAEPGDDPGLHL